MFALTVTAGAGQGNRRGIVGFVGGEGRSLERQLPGLRSSVAVFGCGGIGLNAVQGARIVGALKIIAVDVAPHKLEYPYKRSVGKVLGAFFTALREQRIVGVRARDGRVLVPPQEYDPVTSETLDEIFASPAGLGP